MKFYCTAGRGTETFVAAELMQTFGPNIKVTSTDGKTYFTVNECQLECDIWDKLMSLKTVERIFVQVLHENYQKSDRRGLLTLLHTSLNDKSIWEECISTLDQVRATKLPAAHRGGTGEKVGNNNTGDKIGKEISAVNTDTGDKIGKEISAVNTDTGDTSGNKISAVNGSTAGYSDNKLPAINSYPTDCCSSTKRRKLDDCDTCKVTFRVSCRVSGFPRKQLNIQKTSQQMGVLISKLLGWRIDLQNPKYEINIYLSDDTLTVGIPLTSLPLSRRSYIKHCGLRTPVAWIMAGQLDIHPGDVVLDSMCGMGTILLEGACMCQNAVYIGMDKDVAQLNLCLENITYKRDCHIILFHGDTRQIPLPDSSVDKFITDAPFGQNHTVSGDLQIFYHQFLKETVRVVKPGGRIVVLTSTCMAPFLQQVCDKDVLLTNHNNDSAALPYTFDSSIQTVQQDLSESLTQATACVLSAGSTSHEMIEGSDGAGKQLDLMPCRNVNFSLTLKASYNVKLGETEGCIFVMQNSEKLKF